MKRVLCLFIALVLALCAASALAEGVDAKIQNVRGNASFTAESYPEIWITPVYADYIITGYDAERYPSKFLRFAPPEGATLLEFRYDLSSLIDFDSLLQYTYYAYDRYAFELFLEKAEPDNIVSDGSDGAAIYIRPDNRRGCALIDIKDQFGGTAKLEIEVYDHTGDLKPDELRQLIVDETARVKTAMALEELDGYWSRGGYQSVELYDDHNEAGLSVNVDGMIITRLATDKLVATAPVEGQSSSVSNTEIAIDSYVRDEATDATLASGTEYRAYTTDYSGYAYFYLKEGKYSGQVYLSIQIDCAPDEFAAKLEEVYGRITLNVEA